jgi:hypothetical protein
MRVLLQAVVVSVSLTALLFLIGILAFAQDAQKGGEKSGEPAPLAGCASSEITSGKEKGKQERFFAAPLPKVKEALTSALAALEFEVKKDSGNEMEASKRRHMGVFVGSGGEKMALSLAEAAEGGKKGTRVTAETKKGFVGRAGQKSWTNAVLDQTSCMLEKSGT